jgi:hypothetical protein
MPDHLKVLIAMAEASSWSTRRLPYEEIVIQAWKQFPESFSLRSHPEHPDSSDVHKRIYQTLKPAGLAVSLGNKFFRLTEEGIRRARSIQDGIAVDATERDSSAERLDRSEQDFVEHALASPALEAWRAGRGSELIDYDARSFFEFTTGTKVPQRAARVTSGLQALAHANRLGVIGAGDAHTLGEMLAARFAYLWKEEES